jgi:hypothetical protein
MLTKSLTKFTAWKQLTYILKEKKLTMKGQDSEVKSTSEASDLSEIQWRYKPEDRMFQGRSWNKLKSKEFGNGFNLLIES